MGKKGKHQEHGNITAMKLVNATTMKSIGDGEKRVVNGESVERDGTDGSSDKNGGLTTHHGMNDRNDATPTSNGMRHQATERRVAFTKNTINTAIESTATRSVMDNKGGQGGVFVHNPYQRKSAVKSSVALVKDDSPLQSIEMLAEGVDTPSSVPRDGTISNSALAVTSTAHLNKANKVNEATTSLDATMPADKELMTLPLLGIGAKHTAKNKSSCSKKFGVSSNIGRSHT